MQERIMETNSIKSQYENWVYPEPIFNLEQHLETVFSYHDVSDLAPLYCRRESDIKPREVLIAGCGTNQAAVHAFKNPDISFTAIDVSINSLEHQKLLKQKYGLTNLHLLEKDIRDVSELNQSFDHIISTGVLHHFPDPSEPLRAITKTLRKGGVLNLMLYGKSMRVGVYMLQEAFSKMGLSQTKEDVELVKSVLENNISSSHPVYHYSQAAQVDLSYDGGIVDTFLNPIDHAYSVAELYSLLESCGLTLDTWITPWIYEPTYFFGNNPLLLERIKLLEAPIRHHVTDLLIGKLGTHRFLARPIEDIIQPTNLAERKESHARLRLHPLCKLVKRQDRSAVDIVHNTTVLGTLPPEVANLLVKRLDRPTMESASIAAQEEAIVAPYLTQLLEIGVVLG
jgi:SAM-dependent methyltransferase